MLLITIYVAFITIIFFGMLAFDILGYTKSGKHGNFVPWYPKVLVIIPVKGADIELRKNLEAAKTQEYKGSFDIIAVADEEKDYAVKIASTTGVRHIISSAKCKKCSGKVRAIATALKKFEDYDVYVILDSDVRVDRRWLGRLVAPLRSKKIGLSTTFPLFVPHRQNFWSYAKMVWGLVGLGLMENNISRFGWGGSMAFKRDMVDRRFMELLTNSKYSASDDICVTKAVRARGMEIEYVKDATPFVPCDESAETFFEWSDRQTAFTLLGYRKNLQMGLVFYSAEALLFLSGIIMATLLSPIFAIFLLHTASSIFKAYRRTGSRSWLVALLVLIMPFLYMGNLLHARNTDSVTWRGVRYRLGA